MAAQALNNPSNSIQNPVNDSDLTRWFTFCCWYSRWLFFLWCRQPNNKPYLLFRDVKPPKLLNHKARHQAYHRTATLQIRNIQNHPEWTQMNRSGPWVSWGTCFIKMGEGILRGWPCPDWTLENQLDGVGVHQLFFFQGNIFIDNVVNGKANYKPSPKSLSLWVVYVNIVNHSQMVGKNLMMDTEELWLMRLNIRNCRNPSVDMNRFDKTKIVSLSSMHNSPYTPYQAHLASPVCISLLGMFSPHVLSAKVKTWGQNHRLPRSSSNLLYK